MWTSYSAPISRAIACVAVAAALCQLAGASDRKAELYRQAKAAEDGENVAEAARLYCEVARLDPDYKDAQTMCDVMRQEADRVARHYEDVFSKAVMAFQQGNLDEAEQGFKNVRKGPRVPEAQQYLAKIRSARQSKAAADAEQYSAAAFNRGEQAFRRNDFPGAKAAFSQVAGSRQSDAQSYLATVARYEQAMTAGDQAASAGNLQAALAAYRSASEVKKDGPGDVTTKIAQIAKRLEAENQPAPLPPRQPETPARATNAAVANLSQGEIAVLLKDAQAAARRGDRTAAKAKYQRVLAADRTNKIAIRGIARLEGVSEQTAAAGRSEALLATALRDFYAGDYLVAEVRLQDYVNSGGKRQALSYFFLGTCKLSRYYLADNRDRSSDLLAEVRRAFRTAAQTPEFSPPRAEYVSPKILKAYAEMSK